MKTNKQSTSGFKTHSDVPVRMNRTSFGKLLLALFVVASGARLLADDFTLLDQALARARSGAINQLTVESEKGHRALVDVAELYALRGEFSQAVSTIDLVHDRVLVDLGFYRVMLACLKTGRPEWALDAAKRMSSTESRCDAYTTIAAAHRKAGKQNECDRLLREALKSARGISAIRPSTAVG